MYLDNVLVFCCLSFPFIGDNPKDSPQWDIYPHPPKPSYPVEVDEKGEEVKPFVEEFSMNEVFIPGLDENVILLLFD